MKIHRVIVVDVSASFSRTNIRIFQPCKKKKKMLKNVIRMTRALVNAAIGFMYSFIRVHLSLDGKTATEHPPENEKKKKTIVLHTHTTPTE